MEEQEQQLRSKREQLGLEAEMAATNAGLADLLMWDIPAQDQKKKKRILSWKCKQGKKSFVSILNPMGTEYQHGLQKSTQQSLINPNKQWDVLPKDRGPCFKAAVEHWHNMHNHQEG